MKTRVILELHIFRTVWAMLALASLILSLTPGAAATSVNASSKRSAAVAANRAASDGGPADSAAAQRNYGALPLSFEPNQGQADRSVKFLSRGKGYTLFLTPTEAVFRLQMSDCGMRNPQSALCDRQSSVLRMKLLGSRTGSQLDGQEALEGKVNYLIGNDQSQWQRNVPTYRQVRYEQVWPGIDMLWHGRQQELEYDFIVQPGADPSQIRLRFEGADELRLDGEGNLLVQTKAGEVVQHAPVIYQDGDQGRTTVAGKYVLRGKREVGFEIDSYDARKPLVIDPVLVYSTYLGGNLLDAASGIAVNSAGEAFITGQTSPPSTFPRNNELAVQNDVSVVAFVTKLRADGTGTVYSTLIGNGGFGGNVEAEAIAITSDGKAAITGVVDNRLGHSEFPITGNAYQDGGRDCLGVCNGRGRSFDAFVTVLNAQGNGLFYSTFFAGSSTNEGDQGNDLGEAIAVDSVNHIYITGSSSSNNLPTQNAFQSSRKSWGEGFDAFVAVFDPSQERGNDTLLYASYLGGEGDDVGRGVAVDASGNAYVVGSTASTDLKTKSPSGLPPLQENFQGGGFDGFVAKIDTESEGENSLTYLTYFGGNINDRVESVAVDSSQRAYITGASNS
ncbi:MAG TPA: SBBP repeat-containing protein [Pyrinomonadaceae bacterium]|nr:SBBP repeat-containing protein [Pyrinomonadaceae bacterium]